MSQNINDLGTIKTVITCPNLRCGAKLRVPVGEGKLHVTCPKCGLEFMHDSGGEKEKAEVFKALGLDKVFGKDKK